MGKIVAIKGLGGYHLVCDATNEQAVCELRKRKARSNKAFAIMAQNIKDVTTIAYVNDTEEKILSGTVRPIVLLNQKTGNSVTPAVTNGLPEIGVMLPHTPVQHILMHDFCNAGGKYLVMTSGNLYDGPIITNDDQATKALDSVADAFLGNNREILERFDDSVLRVIDAAGTDAVQMIRRARGYAPSPIKIKFENNTSGDKFAVGPEQKNTFAFSRPIPNAKPQDKYNTEVFVSQHIGDCENSEIFETWEKTKDQYKNNLKLTPKFVSADLHPDYLTTK